MLGLDETTGCVRLWVRRAPGGELLVFREHGLDQLVDDVVGVLVDERGVRVQRLVVLLVETGAVFGEIFPLTRGLMTDMTPSRSREG